MRTPQFHLALFLGVRVCMHVCVWGGSLSLSSGIWYVINKAPLSPILITDHMSMWAGVEVEELGGAYSVMVPTNTSVPFENPEAWPTLT